MEEEKEKKQEEEEDEDGWNIRREEDLEGIKEEEVKK